MSALGRSFALLLAMACALSGAARAQDSWTPFEASFGTLGARIRAASTEIGYAEVWLRARAAPDAESEVGFDVSLTSGWSEWELARWTGTLAPGQTVETQLLLPSWVLRGNDIELSEPRERHIGRLSVQPISPAGHSPAFWGGPDTVPLFYASASAPQASRLSQFVEELSAETLPDVEPFRARAAFSDGDPSRWHARAHGRFPSSTTHHVVRPGGITFTTTFPPPPTTSSSAPGTVGATTDTYSIQAVEFDDLPSRAIELTSAAGVVVDAGSFLPDAPALTALVDYARLGGVLVLTGTTPARVMSTAPQLAPHVEPRFELASFSGEETATQVFELGLGRLVVSEGRLAELGEVLDPGVRDAVWWCFEREPSWLLHGHGNYAPFLPDAALPFAMMLPRGALAVLCLVLAVVIGPLNFIFAWRRKRPTLLLVSVPVLSFGAALVLGIVGLLSAGFGVDATGASLAMLDQRTGDLAVGEVRGLLPGFTTVPGLRPAPDTVVLPVHRDGGAMREPSARVERDGALLTGDYLPARERARSTVVSARRARQRLDVERAPEGLRVTNGFDATLDALVLCDAEGTMWQAPGPLARGASVVLEPAQAADVEALLTRLAPGPHFTATSRLVPGSYAAELDSPALVADLGISLDWVDDSGPHGVIGRLPLEDAR